MYLLKFGGYTFPASFVYTDISADTGATVSRLPFAPGSNVTSNYLQGRKIDVSGTLFANELLSGLQVPLQTQLDALQAALVSGPQNLQVSDTRYIRNVYAISFPRTYDRSGPERIADIKIGFQAQDAYFYSMTLSAQNTNPVSATPSTTSVHTSGNATALPKITLTIGSGGAIQITVTCIETGTIAVVNASPTVGGKIIIDSLLQTVTDAVGNTLLNNFDGMFPVLQAGDNTIKLDYAGAGTVVNTAIEWRDRYI